MHILFQLSCPRFVLTRATDKIGTGLHSQVGKNVLGATARQVQLAAERFDLAAQRGQAVVQPPATGTTHAPHAGTFIIENVTGQHLPARSQRRAEAGQITQSKILAKPINHRVLHHTFTPSSVERAPRLGAP